MQRSSGPSALIRFLAVTAVAEPADTALREARDRIRSAIVNSGQA